MTMALYLGQFFLTGELLDRVAVPPIMDRCRFLSKISFEVADRVITAAVAGRYALIRFGGTISAGLQGFECRPPSYRVVLTPYLDLQPRMLNPLIGALLKKNLAGRPGIDWSGKRLCLELAGWPFFAPAAEKLCGDNFFLKLGDVPASPGRGGILFNFYLDDLSRGSGGNGKEED